MVLTGDPVDAERALRLSLISELLLTKALLARARELAVTIASRLPIAAQAGKANLRAAYAMPLEAAVGYEATCRRLLRDRGRAGGARRLQGARPRGLPRPLKRCVAFRAMSGRCARSPSAPA
jgi:enoyl-CoA hydratase/carnithine racemase